MMMMMMQVMEVTEMMWTSMLFSTHTENTREMYQPFNTKRYK